MIIEKINENQIRVTLSREDLDSRKIKLSEMKYGKPTTLRLFKDIISEAHRQYHFNEEGMCLMIDATPLSSGSLVLMITKVRYPDEIDARFTKFSPSVIEDLEKDDTNSYEEDYEEDPEVYDEVAENNGSRGDISGLIEILDRFSREYGNNSSGFDISIEAYEIGKDGSVKELSNEMNKKIISGENTVKDKTKGAIYNYNLNGKIYFCFENISCIMDAVKQFKDYDYPADLYRNIKKGEYIMRVHFCETENHMLERLCNNLTEFGQIQKNTKLMERIIKNECEPVIEENAIKVLSNG